MEGLVENIRAIAKSKGMSIQKVERAAGIANGVICKWNMSAPRLDKLVAVAGALDVTVDELLGIKKEPADSELDEQIIQMVKILSSLPEEKLQRVRDFLAGISGS